MTFFLMMGVVASLLVQAANPSLDEITRRSASALGGEEKIKTVQSLRLSGTMVTPPVGDGGAPQPADPGKLAPLSVTFYLKLPHLARMDLRLDRELMTEVVDTRAAGNKPEETLAALIQGMLRQLLDILNPIAVRGSIKAKLLGREILGTKPTYKVELTGGGNETYVYLDSSSFLRLRQSELFHGVDFDSYYSDYRRAGGLLIPHAIEFKAMSEQTFAIVKFDSIELNSNMDEGFFKTPPKR